MGTGGSAGKLRALAGRGEVRITALYIIFGALWILFSDRLLFLLVDSPDRLLALAMYKGWAYVAASAGLFYLLLRAEARKVESSKAELLDFNRTLERKVAERTALLEKSNLELEDLYNNAPCGYHSLDKDGVFVKINDTELAMLGRRREDVVGKLNLADVVTPESLATFRENFPRFMAAGSVKDLEFTFVRADGGTFIGLLSATAIKDAAGRYLHSRSVMLDITEKRRHEDSISSYARRLEDANKELESFSYSASHDLRAPLRAIDGFSSILQDEYGPRLDDEGRRLIGVIKANTAKMGALIEDLLAYARITRKDMQPVRVNMNSLAAEAWRDAAPEGWAGSVEMGDLPPAEGDTAALRQVWTNLLSNAVKFTGKKPEPRIKVSARRKGTFIEYSVSDNGAGFDQAYAGKLFGIFQRLHQETEFKGTGVGLAITQRVISRHGGTVRAEGREGEGATFTFTLPAPARDGREG